ncbi:MAG: hypothetical protein MRY72_02105 [Aquisalinus sp.]|nr:hypothetical protein [Aquisalinus sp.]
MHLEGVLAVFGWLVILLHFPLILPSAAWWLTYLNGHKYQPKVTAALSGYITSIAALNIVRLIQDEAIPVCALDTCVIRSSALLFWGILTAFLFPPVYWYLRKTVRKEFHYQREDMT